ncbi:hypothetical protein BJ165DRAFT_1533617 [Panaeolus papilionaceus]|nr:hypothetical protein BJ165DRAFT_1533617 [Panaeolus papilionaceus]
MHSKLPTSSINQKVSTKIISLLTVAAAAVSADGFTITAWSSIGYTGSSKFQTSSSGTHSLGFLAKTYNWISSPTVQCRIKFCNGSTETGYYCDSYSESNVASSSQFTRTVTGCGLMTLRC